MSEIKAVLLVPEKGDPHGLLTEGSCGGRPVDLDVERARIQSLLDMCVRTAACAACNDTGYSDNPGIPCEAEGCTAVPKAMHRLSTGGE